MSMVKQSLRVLTRSPAVKRAPLATLSMRAPIPGQFAPQPRMLSTTSRVTMAAAQDGLSADKLRKLREIEENIMKSANDITADMATAMLGPPELAQKAKAHLDQYGVKVTNDLADALGCKPEDIDRVAQHFTQAAQRLQTELDAAMNGDKDAAQKFQKDLNDTANAIQAETLQLMGYSTKDIQKARDQFAAASEQVREQVGDLAKQGRGAIRDQVKAEEAVGLAIARFSRDLTNGVNRHRLEKDAEKVAQSIRLAIDPQARERKAAVDNTMYWVLGGFALVAGGYYAYKASQPPPPLPSAHKIEKKVGDAVNYASDKAGEVSDTVKDAAKRAEDQAKKLVGK